MKTFFVFAAFLLTSTVLCRAQDKTGTPASGVPHAAGTLIESQKQPPFKDQSSGVDESGKAKDAVPPKPDDAKDIPKWPTQKKGFQWGTAAKQSLMFLAVQHGYAMTQPKTRRDLKGPFFKDYFRSVRSLSGWADGGKFFTNYVAHPMQGSFLGFVQVQNDPSGRGERFSRSGTYWKSRMKAMAWSAAWSTQFEIGPVSQASIGNVGLHGKQTYVDIVVTPTIGTGMLVMEDILDKYVVTRLERRGFYYKIFSRMIFNPTKTAANLIAFRKPWYRDNGLR
jgi:hypothetical protein